MAVGGGGVWLAGGGGERGEKKAGGGRMGGGGEWEKWVKTREEGGTDTKNSNSKTERQTDR